MTKSTKLQKANVRIGPLKRDEIWLNPSSRFRSLIKHDLRANAPGVCREGKPLHTFPDHALASNSDSQATRECLMLRWIGFFVLALSLLSSPSVAGENKVSVQLNGIGAMTCAHWRSTAASRAEGTVWIFGFWSGLNYVAAASEQGQANSEEKVVLAEVVRACATDPSQVLASAAWAAYIKLAKK